MKILVLSSLFPPHHAGTYDLRCESITEALRLRGHQILVLTSNHGVKGGLRDGEIQRRLLLHDAYGYPRVTKYSQLKALELENHSTFREVAAAFAPDLIHVHSLHGISKSLVFSLRSAKIPVVYDVADSWLHQGVGQDAWLRFWNAPSLPFLDQSTRRALEISGERGRLDPAAPTRMVRGYDRLPTLYGTAEEIASVTPNSLLTFRIDRVYFSSLSLKQSAELAGFNVTHGDVIYPGVSPEAYVQEPRPAAAPVTRFLMDADLTETSGAMTVLEALKLLRQHRIKASLSVFGRGDSNYIAKLRSFAVMTQLPVEFLAGSTLSRDVPAVFRAHDAFIYAAEQDEQFPAAILEAMAAGLPVIGAMTGGAAELVRHGENGLSFTPGKSVELAARMREIQDGPELRLRMAETAQQEVMGRYNHSTFIDQIEAYLTGSLEVWTGAAL